MGDDVAAGNGRFMVVHSFPSPALEATWREFLTRVESPEQYDSPDFFLEPYWKGNNPFAVLAFDGDRIIGSATGLHTAGTVDSGLPSRPQICVAKDADPTLASNLLVDGLLTEAGTAKLITAYGWEWTSLPAFSHRGFRTQKLAGNVVLDLRLGPDALYKQFHENRKRNIKAAVKNGIEVSEAKTSEDLAAYTEVYSAWLKTMRKKIKMNPDFPAIAKTHEMRETHRRFLARHQGKVIAATGVRFLRDGLIVYAGNCSYDRFIHLRPNDLLIWKTIQWACEQGFVTYSLGGAHPFLVKSGGRIVPIYRYRLDRTFLRRVDLKEDLSRAARLLVSNMPAPVETAVRRALRKPKAP
jgi:Acetyltransferase (GNAT) domain